MDKTKAKNTQELKGIIIEYAKKHFSASHSYCKNEEGEGFTFEIYTDYRDVLDDSTIKEAMESHDTIENQKYHLYDYLQEINVDAICDYEHEIAKEVAEYILYNLEELEEGVAERLQEENMLDASEIRDILLDNDVMGVVIDFDQIFARSELNMIISLENEVSVDHEFSLSNFGGGLLEWIENTQELLNEGEIEEKDISLITLLKTQGYTLEAFKAYADGYFNDENHKDTDKFMTKLIVECLNTTSICNALVFTTQVNLKDYMNETISISSIDKKMVGGYVDFVYGGGSVLELKLNKDIDLSEVEHKVFVDGSKYGYGIKDIYGEFMVRS